MIILSNGHTFEYMTASGALGFAGKGWWWEQPLRLAGLLQLQLFTSVTKTLTLRPTVGNVKWYAPTACVCLLSGGVVNAVGLANPGINWWCRQVGPYVNAEKIPLVGSIFGEPAELTTMANMLNDFDLVGLEINSSCPNTATDTLSNVAKIIASCETVKKNSRLPVILKLSVTHDIAPIIAGVSDLVEAIAVNSVPWSVIFPNQPSPLAKYGGGGVSGKIAQRFTWPFVRHLFELTTIPIIGLSVWDFDDLDRVRQLGASAVSFGSVFIPYPWRPTLMVRRDKKQNA